MNRNSALPDRTFLASTVLTGFIVVFLIGFVFYTAAPVLGKEGLGFLTGTEWSYDDHTYGIWNFIVSTLLLTAETILIAFPLGIFTAIFLAEWAPVWLERIVRPSIEMLVGIPSVVYGLFGFFVLENVFQYTIDPFIDSTLGFIPLFRDTSPNHGLGYLLAATVLAVMVLPTIVALSMEAMRAVPRDFREASYALGATKWETIKKIVVPASVTGILTGLILGLMRAMGETMAVVMLIGCNAHAPRSVLDTGYAMTSKILNDIGYWCMFQEPLSALFGIGAVLFLIEMAFVLIIRYIGSMSAIGGR
jgi:phosphate transport system permease protein